MIEKLRHTLLRHSTHILFVMVGLIYCAALLGLANLYGYDFIHGEKSGVYWFQVRTQYLAAPIGLIEIGLTIIWLGWALGQLIYSSLRRFRAYLLSYTVLLILSWLAAPTMLGGTLPPPLGVEITHQDQLSVDSRIYYLAQYHAASGPQECWGGPAGCVPGSFIDYYEVAIYKCDRYGILCNHVYQSNDQHADPIEASLDWDRGANSIIATTNDGAIYVYRLP